MQRSPGVMGSADGHQGGAGASHQLHVRPAGRGAPARRPAAPGAALAHPDRGLLAAGRAGRPLRQLAAGRVRQLPGPAGVPRPGPQPDHHRRADRRPEGDQPVRLLHRGLRRARRRSTTPRRWPRTSSRTCGRSTRTARAPGPASSPQDWVQELLRRPRHPHHRLPGRAQPRRQRRRRLQRADGTRRADARPHPAHRRSGRAATRRGCWCRSCASSAWPPGSSPATWCS